MIISKLGNCEKTIAKHECFFEACLGAIDKVEELRKALIPFFYITLHYKFAYIDMFVWHNDQPYMVEIKSTRYHNNNSFKISSSEVNEALANENYMLVRVTPESINFLGSPINLIKDQITFIKGQNYEMIPDGFTFRFTPAMP